MESAMQDDAPVVMEQSVWKFGYIGARMSLIILRTVSISQLSRSEPKYSMSRSMKLTSLPRQHSWSLFRTEPTLVAAYCTSHKQWIRSSCHALWRSLVWLLTS